MPPVGPSHHIRLAAASLQEVASGFFSVRFFALGSHCQLFYGAPSRVKAEHFRAAAASWLELFENRFSRFLPASELSRVNAAAGGDWVAVDKAFEMLLELCGHSFFLTEGAFDATSLPLTQLWDWRRRHEALPRTAEISEAKRHVDWTRVQREPGRVRLPDKAMQLDFGGVGKEFAVDALRQLAMSLEIGRILVDLGGDIAVHGDSPEGGGWYVGLEDPAAPGKQYMAIRLQPGQAVATSGDYLRRFEFGGRSYGHILDCRTGWPVANDTRTVTVISSRCVTAGLLSTSAMIIGGSNAIGMLERSLDVQGCLWSGGKLYETRGFRKVTIAPDLQKQLASK